MGSDLEHSFVDLGMLPLRESFFNAEQVDSIELYFLLNAFVCGECFPVRLKEYVSPEQTRGQKWSAARRSARRFLSFLSSVATCTRVRSGALGTIANGI
jgi:Putative zinc binding domain